MALHAVIGAHAALGDVPSALQRLEGLDVQEPVGLQRRARTAGSGPWWADRRTRHRPAPAPRQAPAAVPRARACRAPPGRTAPPSPATSAQIAAAQIERGAAVSPKNASRFAAACARCSARSLVGDDASLGPHGAAQRHGERSRPGPGLQHAGAREDVGVGHDRPEVLRIDHLRAARHLQHEVGEPRAERREHHALRRRDPRALVRPIKSSWASVPECVCRRCPPPARRGRCGRAGRPAAPAPPPRKVPASVQANRHLTGRVPLRVPTAGSPEAAGSPASRRPCAGCRCSRPRPPGPAGRA